MDYMNKMPLNIFKIFSADTIEDAYKILDNLGEIDGVLISDKYGNIETIDDIVKIQDKIKDESKISEL
jgi:hypothetical protein